jgi:hypothetical protein
MPRKSSRPISLAPGFSPVWGAGPDASRFNGLPRRREKPLKRLNQPCASVIGLKPGANEMGYPRRMISRSGVLQTFILVLPPCH